MGKQRQSVHLNSSIWAKHTMLEVLSRSGSICVEGMDRWRLDRNPSIWCSILTWNVICPQPSDLTHWLPPAVCVLLELPASSVSCASSQLRLILKWIFKDFHLPQLSYQELNFIWNKSFLVVVPKPYLLTYSKIFFHNVCKSACLTFLRVNFKLKTETSFNLDFGRGVEVWVSGKRFEG